MGIDASETPPRIESASTSSTDRATADAPLRQATARPVEPDLPLQTTTRRLNALLAASPTILYSLRLEGERVEATWVSDNIHRILGFTVAEALEPGWWFEHVHPDDRQAAAGWQARFGAGDEFVHEYRFLDRSGRVRRVRDQVRRERNEADGTSIVGAWTDVTDQRIAEAALSAQASALDAAANAIVVTDTNGRVTWANRAFLGLTGYRMDEAIGQTQGTLVRSGHHPETFYREMWATILSGRVWQGEVVNRRKDGSTYEEEMTITPVFDDTGRVSQFVAVKQNVTERNHLRAELARAQRLESVGRLAGGIAHDFNNLLTVINSYAELGRVNLSPGDPLFTQLHEIQQAGRRAAELTRQLLAFSRRQMLHPSSLDLNRIIEEMFRMLGRLIGEHIALHFHPAAGLWMARGDHGQVEQVIMNLAVNARDAMPDGGTITIDTANVTLGGGDDDRVAPGDYVAIAVSDTGRGIPPEVRAHIFEPFYTTKPQGQGTGLGLSTVYGIVRQSGGTVEVTTSDAGTCFRILLPRSAGASARSSHAEAAGLRQGQGTLLIVEDDEAVRGLAASVAEIAGYAVITAENGPRALDLLRRHRVDLVVSDIVMPGMPGTELARRAADVQPGVRFLFMSGYADEALARQLSDIQAPLLGKPFTPAEFARMVGEMLEGAGRTEG
jgi:PAS domain S-box-containing protein